MGAIHQPTLGCRQAVRHQTLTLASVGSNPAIPAKSDPLAQSAEQLPFKQWVRGSNPRRVTKKSHHVFSWWLFVYLQRKPNQCRPVRFFESEFYSPLPTGGSLTTSRSLIARSRQAARAAGSCFIPYADLSASLLYHRKCKKIRRILNKNWGQGLEILYIVTLCQGRSDEWDAGPVSLLGCAAFNAPGFLTSPERGGGSRQ